MQPTYQTPWTRLEGAHNDLVKTCDGSYVLIRPLVFLCGLKLSYTYFCANTRGEERAGYISAAHLLDDGLDDAARLALETLMKIIPSRDLRATIRMLPPESDPDSWAVLLFAFLKLPKLLTPVAKRWIEHGNRTSNWIRLSFGMGARAIWDTNDFALEIIRTNFTFRNQKGEDITRSVVEIVNRFAWDSSWLLPEV